MLNEFAQWKTQTKGTTIFFDRPTHRKRIDSHHEPHQPADSGAACTSGERRSGTSTGAAGRRCDAGPVPSDPQQLVLETTQNYYKSIDHLMADLKGRKGEARTIGQIGLWFGSYANRVDKLPILNVDEQMLQYGQYVAQQLRNASMAIKGYGINKRVAEVNADSNAAPFGGAVGQSVSNYYANGSYGLPVGTAAAYGWASRPGGGGAAYVAGKSEMRQAFAARAQVDSQLKAGAATSVQQIMEQLREATRRSAR